MSAEARQREKGQRLHGFGKRPPDIGESESRDNFSEAPLIFKNADDATAQGAGHPELAVRQRGWSSRPKAVSWNQLRGRMMDVPREFGLVGWQGRAEILAENECPTHRSKTHP
jgi:hypothetical protein